MLNAAPIPAGSSRRFHAAERLWWIEEKDKMTFKKALLAATVMALPLAAQAQPVTGVYVGAGAGLNILQDADITSGTPFGAGVGTTRTLSAEFDNGFGGVLSIGYGFGNGLRAEIEGNYRQNDVAKLSRGGALTGIGGTVRTYGVMANALYDFDFGLPVVPYVGAGVGYAWTEYDQVRSRATFPGGNSVNFDDTDGQFAFQGIVGAAFPIAAVPGLAITGEYRFFGTLEPSFSGVSRSGTTGQISRVSADSENYNHSIFLGLRYAFNAPRPAAPVAPVAPAPAAA
ncbi:outer membrane family protein, partial [Acetobacteraceae bacterium AT-5844]